MATGRPEITVIMTADDQDLNKDLDKAERKMMGFSKGGALAFAAVAAAVVAAVAAFKKLISTLNELEQLYKKQKMAEQQLESTLRATGYAAGFTADQLKEFAGELQDMTNFADEETLPLMAKLATFNKITGEQFKRATLAAQDLAAAGFGNLETNAIQLGKALQDPIKGINALSRNGISFTNAERDMIRELVETNRLMDAQNTILAAVEGQVQGTAMAVADAGIQMQNAMGDVGEKVGEVWNAFKEPIIMAVLEELKGASGDLEAAFDRLATKTRAFSMTVVDAFKAMDKAVDSPGFKALMKIGKVGAFLTNPLGSLGLSGTGILGRQFEENYEQNLRAVELEKKLQELKDKREKAEADARAEEKKREQEAQQAMEDLLSTSLEIGAVELPMLQVEPIEKYEKAAESAANKFKSADKALANYLARNSGFNASIVSLTGLYNRMQTAAASRTPEDRQLSELKERRREAERQHKETKTELEKQTAALEAITIESDGPRFVPGG